MVFSDEDDDSLAATNKMLGNVRFYTKGTWAVVETFMWIFVVAAIVVIAELGYIAYRLS